VQRNQGFCPEEAFGKRVRVRLRNGLEPKETWAASGRDACRWTLENHPFDIMEWELAQ
jgi:hypothetical protein